MTYNPRMMYPQTTKHQDEQLHLEPLNLNFMDFKKKKSVSKDKKLVNALSQRKNNQSQNLSFQNDSAKTDRMVLLQKKKNYSAAIRQRNLLLKSNNKKQKSRSSSKSNKSNSMIKNKLKSMKQNCNEGVHVPKKKQIIGQKVKTGTKIKTGSKIRNKSRKNHSLSMSALDLQPIPYTNIQTQQATIIEDEDSLDIAEYNLNESINQKNDDKMKIISSILSLTFFQSHSQSTKKRSKQNINPKNQNSGLYKQLQNCKNQIKIISQENKRLENELMEAKQYIEQLKNRAEQILEQSIGMTRFSMSSHHRNSQEVNNLSLNKLQDGQNYKINNVELLDSLEHQTPTSPNTIQYYEQLIKNLQKELKEAQILNSGLELKALMSEKKMIEQTNGFRKKVAKQIAMWRQKCAQLRSANMRLKSKKEVTISMQISKDEE